MDDSEPPELPVELEGAPEPAVLTRVQTVDASEVDPGSPASSCLQDKADAHPQGTIVERVGIVGESVTFGDASGRAVHGCGNSLGPRERGAPWCDGSYGPLDDGRLRDPRLGVLCQTSDGAPIGFAWIQPPPGVGYVALIEPDYTEIYPVAGGLPIRVATVAGVRIEETRATFEIREYDAAGQLLREYAVDTSVAS
jgi:hypothetical protein